MLTYQLRILSDPWEKNYVVFVRNFPVNDIKFESADKIKIQGVCGSYQEVAEIEEALEKSGMFETVTRNQTGNAQDGKTKFEISVVLKSKA